jgi:hypothetical protein
VTVERPGGHSSALQDGGDGDRPAVGRRQAPVGGIDDATAIVLAGAVWLHDRKV